MASRPLLCCCWKSTAGLRWHALAGWLAGQRWWRRCLDDMKHTLASGATQEYRTSRWGEARTSTASGSPVCSLFDQGCIARCQQCSQGARLCSAGKHPLPIALQRHIIIVTIVYDIRKRSTARHFQALALAAPDAERQRTCVSVSGKILAVSCGSPTDGSWRGTLLSNHRADGETRVRRNHKVAVRLGEADAGGSRRTRLLSGA